MVRGGTNSALAVALLMFVVVAAVAVVVGVMAHLGWVLAGVVLAGARRLLRRRPGGAFTPSPMWLPPIPRQRGQLYQSRRSHPGG